MKLIEIEKPSETIKKAIDDGIETVHEYNAWFLGYMSGAEDAKKDNLGWLEADWQPSSVTHHTNKETK